MNRLRLAIIGTTFLAMAFFMISCEQPTPPNPRQAPLTRLSNIPKDNDTIFPLAALNWLGGSYDGFVTKYQYRYITSHLMPGSTTQWMPYDSTAWTDTTGTSVLIAFNSTDPINKQVFMVRSVDNENMVDPNPATRTFYTTRASVPRTTITSPLRGDTLLILDQMTDWWSGIPLVFRAVDQTVGGKIANYAWSADGGAWNWVSSSNVLIPPSAFSQPTTGYHWIKVTSRNNTNLVDPVGDSILVVLFHPPFDRKVLIIDETDEFNAPFITYGITDAMTDAFYAEVFPGSDSWDFKKSGMPPRQVLAHYKLVVWHADDIPVSTPHKIADPNNIAVFTDYLKIGGKFLMGGWRILKSFAYTQNFPYSFPPGTFVYDYLHIYSVDESAFTGDCLGGYGKAGQFSDFSVDSAKIAFFPYGGKLGQVNLVTKMAGFTDVLYTYRNRDDSPYVKYRGRAIALRYYGTAFDAVVLGFPMYFINKDDAKTMAREIMQSLEVY